MSGLYGTPVNVGGFPKSLILTDDNGVEVAGVVVGSKTVFTATDNDVREGKVYASDEGVSTGTKEIPAYTTTRGYKLIEPGEDYTIPLEDNDQYQYTQLQCLIAPSSNLYMSTMSSVNDGVYDNSSGNKLSDVTKNSETKSIDLNITNTSSEKYIVYYFTYKEEV